MQKRNVMTVAGALVLAGAMTLAMAAEETWSDVAVVDTLCFSKVKENPDAHTTRCALQCVRGGYGLITPAGEFLAFDAAGNEMVLAALKSTDKKDHLRARVAGQREGDQIQVTAFELR